MIGFIRLRPLSAYFMLAYAISWSWWIPLALNGAVVRQGSASPTQFPGLLGPALAAIIVTAATAGRPGLHAIWRSCRRVGAPATRFWLLALSPAALLIPAAVIAFASGDTFPSAREFGTYPGLPELGVFPVFLLVLSINGFGEEIGWRGFALARLQERLGPLKGTLALAALWAGWHAPMFAIVEVYRHMSIGTILGGFVIGLACGAIVLARVAHAASGSVLAAALWHALYNMTSATAAGRGTVAAVTTTCVMAWAIALVLLELRRGPERSLLSVRRMVPPAEPGRP